MAITCSTWKRVPKKNNPVGILLFWGLLLELSSTESWKNHDFVDISSATTRISTWLTWIGRARKTDIESLIKKVVIWLFDRLFQETKSNSRTFFHYFVRNFIDFLETSKIRHAEGLWRITLVKVIRIQPSFQDIL